MPAYRRVVHVITGLEDGGAEAVLYALCANDKSHEHCVVSLTGPGKYAALLQQVGVRVECLSMPRGRFTLRGAAQLWRLLRGLRPDVVQTWMYHADLVGGVLAKLAGVPRVFWGIHHSTLGAGTSRRTTVAIARLNAWLSPWIPAGIVCCADSARRVHESLGYAVSKFTVIPNGYDLSRFHPDPVARARLRGEWCVQDQLPVVGMVSRFHPLKDHETLLRALGRVRQAGKDFRCVLVGNGLSSDNAQLAYMLEQNGLGDRALLLGQRADVPAIMSALDLHVLSSREEAFPNVLAEAMACGTPCITTDVGDAATIVGETGWVVPPGNAAELARAVDAALVARSDSESWPQRREAARTSIERRFRLESMIGAYRALWDQ
jgi:glycosyltransferase involved in cell wall biosynthesis